MDKRNPTVFRNVFTQAGLGAETGSTVFSQEASHPALKVTFGLRGGLKRGDVRRGAG